MSHTGMFRYKPDKSKHHEENSTLDDTHKKQIKVFEQSRKTLEQKKSQLLKSTDELNQLMILSSSQQNKSNDENSIINVMDMVSKKSKLRSEIEKLTREIGDIASGASELEYYSKIDDILLTYYEILESSATGNHQDVPQTGIVEQFNGLPTKKISRKKSKSAVNNKHILSYFNCGPKEPTSIPDTVSDSPMEKIALPKNRASLLDQYTRAIENKISKKVKNIANYCEKCCIERTLLQSDGIYVCTLCGEVENALIESEVHNYKDSITEKPIYPYKRLNHLVEWLNQFQAKESTDIPNKVYDDILVEMKKARLSANEITVSEMRNILKKLRYNSYYEHIPHLMYKITGKPPPTLSRDVEECIKRMFKESQEPFSKFCPKERTNYLSYSYVLHKLFQILKLDEFTVYFPLLKSREKLRLQDKIWKNICEDREWDFYPSI